jgi:hypothetical protein
MCVWISSLGEIIGNKCETLLSIESWGFCQNNPGNKYLKYEVSVICVVFRTMNFSLENFSHLTIYKKLKKNWKFLKFFV